ncbi:MAG: hypothetical protein NXI24_06685 [bacterium]|nr:hypothetical protein [bacterium]
MNDEATIPIDRARADRILSEREFFRLRLYALELGVETFIAYYALAASEDRERAVCLLPASLLIQEPQRYATRSLRVDSGYGKLDRDQRTPFVLMDGEPGVALLDQDQGGDTRLYAASSLERLLRAGEERVFVNDREGRISNEDLAAPAAILKISTEDLFEDLIKDRLIGSDGVINSRQRRAIQSLGAADDAPAKHTAPLTESLRRWLAEFEATEHSANPKIESPVALLTRGLRARNAVADHYDRPAGLFNFDRGGVNFTAHLGRGEHNVFFEYLIGNRYGHFMPYSFTDAAGDPELSLEIYRELVEREILDSRGRVSDIRRLDGLHSLAARAAPAIDRERSAAILDSVRALLREAREPGIEDIRKALKYDRAAIEADLERTGLNQQHEHVYDFDAVRRFVADSAHENHARFVAAYQESRIHQEINAEAAKNRGVVLASSESETERLLLITDNLLLSAPYYALLLADFQERFQSDATPAPKIRIAHAYHAPTPRNPRKFPHPIVHALQMMDRESTPELTPPEDYHDHEADASS